MCQDWLAMIRMILLIGCESIMSRTQSLTIHTLILISPSNDNPKYWIHKLMSKERFIKECKARDVDTEELWKVLNNNVASILITCDRFYTA